MSNVRDRRKHQNRVEAIAEALDLNHNTTTGASCALASAGLSNSDNPTDLGSLPDDHSHTQAKGDSTNQHMDLYRGATGENLCSECNEITKIFDLEVGIPAKSWRTLDLLACVDIPFWDFTLGSVVDPEEVWKVIHDISKTCSFCSFLMGCASRMAIHTAVDLKSNDWFLALGVKSLEYSTQKASYGRSNEIWRTQILELKLRQNGDTDSFKYGDEAWNNTHLILPVQAYDDGHDEVSDIIDWELIKKWLDTCHSEHYNNCRTDLTTMALEDIPSFCLIDCERKRMVPAKHVRNINYVTLSYVWGDSDTTPQVVDASASVPVLPESNQRPKVVNDAIEVVRGIGYRYLWVDRYCIPQSDHDAKHIQIKNMGKIYSQAALTIIAAAGNDAEYGLPGVSSRPTLQPVWTTIRSGNRAIPVIHFEPPNNDILNSTWNSRGWTYQEALLSKRRLVFTDRHVYFQCESMQSVGYLADHDPYASYLSEVFPFRKNYSLHSWDDAIWWVINDYMQRMLSYEGDALHAVQGILESFRDICDVWFFYGLPVMSLSASDMDIFHNDSAMPDVLSLAVGTFRAVDSGTQEILNTLLWGDIWRKDQDYSDLGTEIINLCRRTRFPSWTWAGWRQVRDWNLSVRSRGLECSIISYYIPNRCSFSIRLSYDDKDLSWPRDRRNIQHRSDIISQFPNFLIITGPVFDVTITCADGEDQDSSSNQRGHAVWRFASPSFLAQMQSTRPWLDYQGPPFSPEEVKSRAIQLVALCLFDDFREDTFHLHMLMLRPVGKDAHGQIYERVTCNYLNSKDLGSDFSLADLNLREMDLRIR